MSLKLSVRSLGLALGLACALLGTSVPSADAEPISLDTWYGFGFFEPIGPLVSGVGFGVGTNPPDGHPVVQVGDPSWTITLTGPAWLTVLDLFLSVDRFEMFDNAASLGLTSAPVAGGGCGSDITCSLGDPSYSVGAFLLGAGDHSLTGLHVEGQGGAAVFQITAAAAAVPEPSSLGLLGAALAGFGLFRLRKSRG